MIGRLLPLLLRCYPADFLARHGRALAQTVNADWQRRPTIAHRTRLIVNLAIDGMRERRDRRPLVPTSKGTSMAGLSSDVLHAWRTLAHRPMFAGITIATLALGLGATIAMFTVADAVLLRPLPYPADQQLVVMTERQASRNLSGASFPAMADWRAFPELESVAGYNAMNLLFQQGELAERMAGVSVSPEFFTTLGVQAAIGRTLLPGAPELEPNRKIVLSAGVWRSFFHEDATVIGRAVVLEGTSYEVIGVMPRGFAFPSEAKFWATLPTSMSRLHDERSLRFMDTIARLRPGMDVAAVRARLDRWKQSTATTDPTGRNWLPEATSLRDQTVGAVRRPLQVVFLGVMFLLLVACSNAAALVLAHGRTKLRDMAVQSALGAGRGRLVRQMLIEGLMLSIAGAALALLIAGITRDSIVALSANQIPRTDEIHFGFRTLLFGLGAGVLTTLLVALGPALVLTRNSHSDRLQQSSRSTTSSGAGRRWFGPLIAVEFALALVLSAAAGLLITSYRHLTAVDSGFAPAEVLTAKLAVPLTREWSGDAPNRRLNADLLDNLRAVPGVRHAALVARLPLSDVRGGTDLWATDDETRKSPALLQLSSEDYFEAMGSHVISGRDFTASDTNADAPVAIINDVLAKTLWPNSDPIGRSVTYQFMKGPVTATIIGIAPAMRYTDLKTSLRPEIYVTFRQALNTPVSIVVKSSLDAATTAAAVRGALTRADATRSVTFSDMSTLNAQLARVLARPRFYLVMVCVFAAVAFMLAALGIYGTMMFWVGERWREFGIRIALGAKSADVTALLLKHGLSFAGVGLVTGLAAVLAGRQLLTGLLFEVGPADPAVLMATLGLLAGAAVIAALVPARRVVRVDPVSTLRAD